MQDRTSRLILSLFGLALLGACDGGTGLDADALTAVEARAIALAVDDNGTEAVDGESTGANLALLPLGEPTADRITVTNEFDVSGPCPRGGTATVQGAGTLVMDDVLGEILFDLAGTNTMAGCAFLTEEDLDVELTGVLEFVAEREIREGEALGSQSHSGSLDYITGDGREGTCVIDVEASFSLATGTATRSVVGTVCGHDVTATTTWTFTQG